MVYLQKQKMSFSFQEKLNFFPVIVEHPSFHSTLVKSCLAISQLNTGYKSNVHCAHILQVLFFL